MNSAALALSLLMFGVNAVVYLIIGVAIPLMVRSGDGVGIGAFHPRPDGIVFGTTDLDPGVRRSLRILRNLMRDWLGGTLAALGVVELGTILFGLRVGESWAYVVLVIASAVMLPFVALVLLPYRRAGAHLRSLEIPPLLWIPAFTLPPAIIFGFLGVLPRN